MASRNMTRPGTVQWQMNSLSSGLHALAAMDQGWPVTETAWATALLPTSIQIKEALLEHDVSPEAFWRHVVPLSEGISFVAALVDVTLRKAVHTFHDKQDLARRLAACIAQADNFVRQTHPDFAEMMTLRQGPLRYQWEAYGPGMIHHIARLTEPELIVDVADVILVYPIVGGAGCAHLSYNSVRLEAMLANPHPRLPEVVRLAWLLAQLHQDLPLYSESLAADRLPLIGALAMLPPVLTAAGEVELTRYESAVLAEALSAWLVGPALESLPVSGSDAATGAVADVLQDWWDTYQGSRPSWQVALASLDRMLSAVA